MLRNWLQGVRKYCVSACVVLAAATGTARADDAAELRQLLETQSRQIQELKQRLDAAEQHPVAADPAAAAVGEANVKQLVDQYLGQKEAAAAAAKQQKADEGYRVGTDMTASAKFNDYGYLWVTTPNGDFTMHPGFWVQYDNVFWSQSQLLKVAPTARNQGKAALASGIASGGIGDLQDGTFFRRIRPFVEGTLWEDFEYRLNIALENNQFSTAGLDEFWMAINKVPLIGTIRAGHVKTVQGFEADMTGSSRTMTFVERSSYSEAIEQNSNFYTGLWAQNAFLDQHVTYTAGLGRLDQGASSGAAFGDGQYYAGGRLTFLPLYENEGRDWLHLGVSLTWRNGQNNAAGNPRTFQLRARPEMRDDDPAGSPGGGQLLNDVNSNRMIDTGVIAAQDMWILGTELCWVCGPLSLQAEYGWNFLDNAYGLGAGFPPTNFFRPGVTDYSFNGGYVQVAYTLTGEARGYDRARGTLSREYFRSGPFTNFWLLGREGGGVTSGLGAIELAARYSYTDLNDGKGVFRVQGGVMQGLSGAINWYLNPNFTLMFDYAFDQRSQLPGIVTGGPGGTNGVTFPGSTRGYDVRAQLSF
jgi:phosphate-selective porin OprO/OprP